VSSSAADTLRFEIHSSRLWALLTFKLTKFFFRTRMSADQHGISTVKVSFWLTPWTREDDHLPIGHVAEIAHGRGLIWDHISVESSGGLNPLTIAGVPKGQAREFVTGVRGLMGK
jgi:hypothetical protein